MKIKKTVPILLTLLIMVGLICFGSVMKSSAPTEKKESVKTLATADESNEEMRGVWISYMELSMENEKDKSEDGFIRKFENIADKCKGFGFNTLVVQVRPFCDALYESDYFPYSHILSGTQGKNPGYDALKIMCRICREKGLKIHAWINPYRAATNSTPSKLSENNPVCVDKSIALETDDGIFLDPSSEKSRELIINGVVEIAEKYDVDGIQFDDYFYPTRDESFDKRQYDEYLSKLGESKGMSLDNWRTANVNMLISEVYKAVHKAKGDIVFGISPQGNFDNNREIYADVRSWCECRRFVDYICPQIYFSIDNPALEFESSLESWCELSFAENVALYVGLAGYKAGSDSDEGTWQNSDSILADEYKILSENNKVSGFMLYSYASLENDGANKELENLKKELILN